MNQKVTLQNLLPSLVFVALIVFVKLVENYLGYKGIKLGVFPRTLEGLLGIITAPFIHGDWKHLLIMLCLLLF